MNYLVFDIGGTAIKYALMNDKMQFLEKREQETPHDSFERFVEIIVNIFEKYKNDIKGIAISMPGRIDSENGYAYSGGALKYNDNKEISKILSEKLKVPVVIENDGKCAALAESRRGNLSDVKDGIVIILGTGVGGGIIKDKIVHRGSEFIAGEFSFIITNSNIKKGEIPTVFALECGVPSGLCKPVSKLKKINNVNGKKVFELLNSGDKEVLEILDNYCYKLAIQLHNLQHIYNPEKIAIGGGISSQDILMDYIQKNISELAKILPFSLSTPNVVRCKFKNDANLIGALENYKLQFCDTL